MLVFQGKKIDQQKKIIFALPKLYGIGKKATIKICNILGFAKNLKVAEMTDDQRTVLTKFINNDKHYIIENDLKKKIRDDIDSLIKINSNRGFCHKNKLPVRGQRSRTNARTQKIRN